MNLSVSLRWLPCAAVSVASSVFASPGQQLPEAPGVVVAGPAATSVLAAMADFSRYQTILDRMPFGALPPNFDPNAPVTASGGGARDRAEMENKLAAAVRLCMLNVTPAGLIAAGFTDSSVNPPVNYYLMVGQSQNGWTVVDADPASQSATLEKDGVSLVLALGAAPAAGGKSGPAGPAVLHRSGLLGRPLAAAASATPVDNHGEDNSFVGKLRARRVAQQQEDAERKAREQADEQKRQEQMDALKLISDELRREREARSTSAAETAGGEAAGVPDASSDAAAAARVEVDRANAAAAAARAEAAAAREAAAQAAASVAAQAESAAAPSSGTKKEDEIPIMGWPATHRLKSSN